MPSVEFGYENPAAAKQPEAAHGCAEGPIDWPSDEDPTGNVIGLVAAALCGSGVGIIATLMLSTFFGQTCGG